jgi:predicted N-formylglutamate amidohydrolase
VHVPHAGGRRFSVSVLDERDERVEDALVELLQRSGDLEVTTGGRVEHQAPPALGDEQGR